MKQHKSKSRKGFTPAPIFNKIGRQNPSQLVRGFTLIELLVVISIISFIASILIVAFHSAIQKGRDAKRVEDIAQLQKGLELYYQDHNAYPDSGGAVAPDFAWSTSNDSSWQALQNELAPYLPTLPNDPLVRPGADFNSWAGNGIGTGNTWTGYYAYSYYSYELYEGAAPYGCRLHQFYMIVYRLEIAVGPDPGFIACNGSLHQYGEAYPVTYIKTIGNIAGQ